jgi:hypothetical protein
MVKQTKRTQMKIASPNKNLPQIVRKTATKTKTSQGAAVS